MSPDLSPPDRAKFTAARHAVALVEDGMRLGLGTGSTAAWFHRLLADRIRTEGLKVIGVPTSSQTEALCTRLGIPLSTLGELGWLDMTVDGADELDPALALIKGGGAALLQEKIVATGSDRMVVIADAGKAVPVLGQFPLPVEVIRFGWETTRRLIEELLEGCDVGGRRIAMRMAGAAPLVTDEGHYILDLHLERIGQPHALAVMLNQIAGVVETGLFIDIADVALVGRTNGSAYRIEPGEGSTDLPDVDPEAEAALIRRLED